MTYLINAQLLAEVEKHGRSPEQDLAVLTDELVVMAKLLQKFPNDGAMTRAFLGGLKYLTDRVYDNLEPFRTQENLADLYAQAQLRFFPTKEGLASMTAYGKDQNMVIRAVPVECSDGQTRHIFVSHRRQTTREGVTYKEGEVMYDPSVQPPSFAEILERS